MWKKPQHDRAQQEQALTQPISVRNPSCRFYPDVSHQNAHTLRTHVLFIQLFPNASTAWWMHFRPATVCVCFMCVCTYRSEEHVIGLSFSFLYLLTIAMLCVSQHICADAYKERVTKLVEKVECVSVWEPTDEQQKTCQSNTPNTTIKPKKGRAYTVCMTWCTGPQPGIFKNNLLWGVSIGLSRTEHSNLKSIKRHK